MSCDRCPCPETCPGLSHHCDWASRDPIDPVHVRSICRDRSKPLPVQEYPALATQARNLWRDIKAFVASGGKLAPKALRKARVAVCESCEHWDAQQRRCTQCGCKGDAKVYSLVAKCPLDKWPQ